MQLLIVNLSKNRHSMFFFLLFNLDNQLMQIINQSNKTIDIQSISIPVIQLGEQLTLALVCTKQQIINLKHFFILEIIKSRFKNYG